MKQLTGTQRIYLMGICGTAMASLAGIFKSMGHVVAGSDQNVYPPMSTMLQNLSIPIFEGFKAENLKNFKPDFVIVGNVISRSNPEAEFLLNSDIPYTSLPKAMGDYVIEDRESYVISGTHGKTTSTALLSWVLESLGEKPGFLIGGIPLNFTSSFRAPQKNSFVIEGDEYDTAFFDKVPKFIHYKPKHVILTSIEFDHADIYKDLNHVKEAFITLLKLIPKDGTLVYAAEDENIKSLLHHCTARKVSFGIDQGDFSITGRGNVFGRNQFGVVKEGVNVGDVALKLFGKHNTLNALGVFALAETLGWDKGSVLGAMASFLGVKRRQEVLLENESYALIEDFAHHPTAVSLTLDAMREKYPERRILAVFEPRSATSRRKVFQNEYEAAFKKADALFLASPFDTSKIDASQRFSSEEVVESVRAGGRAAFLGQTASDLVKEINQFKKPGDVVLVMSNGAFDGIYSRLKAIL